MTWSCPCPACVDSLRAPATDDEPWFPAGADLTAGAGIYTGAWIAGAIVTLPVLLVVAFAIARRVVR